MSRAVSRAVVFDSYGDPDVLYVLETDRPSPTDGQVRVRVEAAGVQPFDALFRRGDAHQWVPASFPQRLGNEFAGIVDEVGAGVDSFAVGDEVLGWAMLSAYSDHVVVMPEQLVEKPSAMPWEQAAVLSASGQTAATALTALAVGEADTVLVHAAAGGVGSFAVQIAVASGARVIGTASPANHDYLRSLGAIPVSYGDGLAERARSAAPAGVDAALDAAGTLEALRSSLDLVSDKDRIGTTAFQPAARELGVQQLSTERSTSRLAELVDLWNEGKLRVDIQRTYPFSEAADAHRAIETGHVRGKLVLVGQGIG